MGFYLPYDVSSQGYWISDGQHTFFGVPPGRLEAPGGEQPRDDAGVGATRDEKDLRVRGMSQIRVCGLVPVQTASRGAQVRVGQVHDAGQHAWGAV